MKELMYNLEKDMKIRTLRLIEREREEEKLLNKTVKVKS